MKACIGWFRCTMLVYLQTFGYTGLSNSNLLQRVSRNGLNMTKYDASLVECDEKQCTERTGASCSSKRSLAYLIYIFIFQPASTV